VDLSNNNNSLPKILDALVEKVFFMGELCNPVKMLHWQSKMSWNCSDNFFLVLQVLYFNKDFSTDNSDKWGTVREAIDVSQKLSS
jgi:hypothetical protein